MHSRALALPTSSPLGGRLYLVPFLDMLNHAGRQTAFLLGGASAAQDNVRCPWHLLESNENSAPDICADMLSTILHHR